MPTLFHPTFLPSPISNYRSRHLVISLYSNCPENANLGGLAFNTRHIIFHPSTQFRLLFFSIENILFLYDRVRAPCMVFIPSLVMLSSLLAIGHLFCFSSLSPFSILSHFRIFAFGVYQLGVFLSSLPFFRFLFFSLRSLFIDYFCTTFVRLQKLLNCSFYSFKFRFIL